MPGLCNTIEEGEEDMCLTHGYITQYFDDSTPAGPLIQSTYCFSFTFHCSDPTAPTCQATYDTAMAPYAPSLSKRRSIRPPCLSPFNSLLSASHRPIPFPVYSAPAVSVPLLRAPCLGRLTCRQGRARCTGAWCPQGW